MDSSYPPYYAYPSAPPLRRVLPQPPRLHWRWVLALSILTLGVFGSVWLFVQANWIRKMREGKSTAFWVALAYMLWLPVVFALSFFLGAIAAVMPSAAGSGLLGLWGPVVRFGSLGLYRNGVRDEERDGGSAD